MYFQQTAIPFFPDIRYDIFIKNLLTNAYRKTREHFRVKRTFAIRSRYLLMNAVALRPVSKNPLMHIHSGQ